jgi:hypothetical protein
MNAASSNALVFFGAPGDLFHKRILSWPGAILWL